MFQRQWAHICVVGRENSGVFAITDRAHRPHAANEITSMPSHRFTRTDESPSTYGRRLVERGQEEHRRGRLARKRGARPTERQQDQRIV